jgi:LPXTG-motif cell wall-anchored protein
MPSERPPRISRRVAVGLGAVAAVVLIALLPNTGLLVAQSAAQYGQSAPAAGAGTPWLVVLAVLALIAIALAILLFRRRSPRPPPEPVESASVSPGTGGGPSGPAAAEDTFGAPDAAIASAAVAVPAGAAYLEGPDDVGASLPAAVPVTVPPAAGGAEGEADIDSLMKELDKISGEILKKGPADKKGAAPAPAPSNDDGASD